MTKYFLIACLSSISITVFSQDTLRISRMEAEAVFLKSNLSLLAEKLQIEQAKADVIQAKLWPNPTLSIGEVNLWATQRQTGGEVVSPGFWGGGNFGKNQQFAFEIEQVIQTAGKRKKLIAIEQVGVHQQEQYFLDLLRNLKWEFRNQLTTLQYLQFKISIYKSQQTSIMQLTVAYQNQVKQGNISKSEYIRLKAQELEFSKNITELQDDIYEAQQSISILMGLSPTLHIVIEDEGFALNNAFVHHLHLPLLINRAKENRPELKLAGLDKELNEKTYQYELAKKMPDIALNMNYDRNGNTMLDFVGFGVSIDLPVFDRNKGNIRKAKLGIEAANYKSDLIQLTVENEITTAHKRLLNALQFAETIEADYESELDKLLGGYTQNFKLRNVSMLEYLDFLQAYLENKNIMLDAQKEINNQVEELQYLLGADL